ncbi:hypothetical protein HHK36_000302 [Tetracentron sinense]|uniref:MINDY deubiquitinase domain-containing protein n=1 Tax=Tetracentron sinense TaxID=13715 RepID=A0A834ZRP7_TETSI|nr:hypothetical protein HHK36_000302 [Tetracentron sinense]
MATEERREEPEKECIYKTKVVQFLGRTTPIILQNDNGPCPLLAICNVLLLRNNLKLSPDVIEISQEKLLSLVAERLIDSNINVDNKDAGYVENQQQNISDAIDLLPRLATGIDVNIQYNRIDDFEFTPECAIFDLLDIPLYHGYGTLGSFHRDINKLTDCDTANAMGPKSYNTLMGELVALETRNTEGERNSYPEEDCIDFVAATTATLGVPCPSLSSARSFDESPRSASGHQNGRKGDIEEEEELLRVLKLSEAELPTSVDECLSVDSIGGITSVSSDENTVLKTSGPKVLVETIEGHINGNHLFLHQPEPFISQDCNASSSYNNDSETIPIEAYSFPSKIDTENHIDQSSSEDVGEPFMYHDLMNQNQSATFLFPERDLSSAYKDHMHGSGGDQEVQQTCPQGTSTFEIQFEPADNQSGGNTTDFFGSSLLNEDSDSSSGRRQHIDAPGAVTSSLDGSEPIYEGEECILDSGQTIYESREPVYEGEIVLAEQADRGEGDACDVWPKDEITPEKGKELLNIRRDDDMRGTYQELFEKQCKPVDHIWINDELYLLATDQGYINQSDLVWEKLNEVNGDTVFMTGNFTEFKVENHVNDTWDEQNVMANTADYLASFDNSAPTASTLNSDLQLALALQQQEFEDQPQGSQRQKLQQSSNSGSSRLVTGPQVQRSSGSNTSSKHDAKPKDKCIVM